jgi:cyclopropane-fatty-acyl-phospholipid synthase
MEDATLRHNTLTASTGLAPTAGLVRARGGPLQAAARRVLLAKLPAISAGELRIVEGGEAHTFGRAGLDFPVRACVRVEDPAFWTRTAFGGTVGAAESYLDGEWSCDDLTALVRILVRNSAAMDGIERGAGALTAPLLRLWHRLRDNTRAGARANIAAHYDLGNDFYALFLDPSMSYSSGIFERADATLEQAQSAKLDRLCRKLDLRPHERLLEIGSGWGSLAIHAASRYGCRVTTATISQRQFDFARERVRAAGLAGRVEVVLADYRDLGGRYDKLVSVEMIEAVGHRWYDTYFRACARLLEPHGLMALQAIVIDDRRYEQALRSVDFIQRHVFPGSTIPSVGALAASVARAGDLRIVHHEDFGPHYARTLRLWRERFLANLDRVRALGFDERFVRLWEYYLCYCEGGFAERQLGCAQMVLSKPLARREPVLGAL